MVSKLIKIFDYRGYRYFYKQRNQNNTISYYKSKIQNKKLTDKTLINSKQFVEVVRRKCM